MKGKTDSNRNGGEEFLATYSVGTYRRLYDKNGYYFLIY